MLVAATKTGEPMLFRFYCMIRSGAVGKLAHLFGFKFQFLSVLSTVISIVVFMHYGGN